MAGAALIGFVWTSIENVSTSRQIAQQTAEEGCKGATKSDCQHLAAELRAAVASEVAADFAGQQLWLNIFGLLGLFATVVYAGAAWREARRSADVAEKALFGLERPFLVLRIVESDIKIEKKTSRYGAVKYQLVNFGRTPAILTRRYFRMTFIEPKPIDPDRVAGTKVAFGIVIGAGGESPTYEVSKAAPLNALLEPHKTGSRERREPYLIGFVRYRDLMGSEYVTGFCLEYENGAFDLASWVVEGEDDRYNYDRKLN